VRLSAHWNPIVSLVSAVLVAAFIALIALGCWHELRTVARLRKAGVLQKRHRRRLHRRLIGFLSLALAVAILINASTFERLVPNPYLRLAWIGMAFVCVLIAVWLAFRDLSETGKMAQEEAQRVVLESLANLQQEIVRAKHEESDRQDSATPAKEKPHDGPQGTRQTRPHRSRRRK